MTCSRCLSINKLNYPPFLRLPVPPSPTLPRIHCNVSFLSHVIVRRHLLQLRHSRNNNHRSYHIIYNNRARHLVMVYQFQLLVSLRVMMHHLPHHLNNNQLPPRNKPCYPTQPFSISPHSNNNIISSNGSNN